MFKQPILSVTILKRCWLSGIERDVASFALLVQTISMFSFFHSFVFGTVVCVKLKEHKFLTLLNLKNMHMLYMYI